jgi:hypothetical protein
MFCFGVFAFHLVLLFFLRKSIASTPAHIGTVAISTLLTLYWGYTWPFYRMLSRRAALKLSAIVFVSLCGYLTFGYIVMNLIVRWRWRRALRNGDYVSIARDPHKEALVPKEMKQLGRIVCLLYIYLLVEFMAS